MTKEKYEGKAKLSLTAMGRIMKLGGARRLSRSAQIALAYMLEQVGTEIVAQATVIRQNEPHSRRSIPVVKARHINTAYALWKRNR